MKTDQIPFASVIVPVYGTEIFFQESIDSILTQSFTDFELIIVSDSPSENLKKLLDSYQQKDARIIVIFRKKRGLISALNTGCKLARGKYIFRMDADDICLKTRFEKQINFMEQNPEIGVLGSFLEEIDETGKVCKISAFPTDPKIIRYQLFFDCCIAHPSVIMRRNIVESVGFYSCDSYSDEDTDLWIKISQITSIANYPEILLKYRIHNANISRNCHSRESDLARLKIKISLYNKILKKEFSLAEKNMVLDWIKKSPISTEENMLFLYRLIIQLFQTYKQETTLHPDQIKEIQKFTGLKLYEILKLYKKIDRTSCKVLISAIRLNPAYCIKVVGSGIKYIWKKIVKIDLS